MERKHNKTDNKPTRHRTGINDAPEKIVHDLSQPLGVQHAVQGPHEDGLARIQLLRRRFRVVRVVQNPGDDLHLLGLHPFGRNLKVPIPAVGKIVGAGLQQRLDVLLGLEDDVHVPLGLRGLLVFAGPLDADGPELFERLDQQLLGDVPGDAPQEHLARVARGFVGARRQHAAPGAGGVEDCYSETDASLGDYRGRDGDLHAAERWKRAARSSCRLSWTWPASVIKPKALLFHLSNICTRRIAET